MLAYIKGELASKEIGYIVIDVGGLGYKVFMSEFSMQNVGNIGSNVKVYTYYRVMEDDISIFGFNSKEELRMFELLISVSGVGAKTAIAMLGVIEPSNFAIAIISEDINTLKKLPGIGVKTAQRIVLELKDKLKKENTIQEINSSVQLSENKTLMVNNKNLEEAISALQVLGYNLKDIETVFERLNLDEQVGLENMIKIGLKELAKK